MAGRRRFLKVGLVGLGLLGAGGAILALSRNPAAERKTVLEGVIPGLLASALPVEAVARKLAINKTVVAVETAIAGLAPSTQDEIAQLFALLASKPGQWLAGVSSWDVASDDDLKGFLNSWRTHKVELFQVSYHALHDLVLGSHYADKDHWASIGYPGPLAL